MKNILAMDDEPYVLAVLVGASGTTGGVLKGYAHVVGASSAAMAVYLASGEVFDCIILDVSMGSESPGGFETARRIRGTVLNKDTPIILTSAIDVSAHEDIDKTVFILKPHLQSTSASEIIEKAIKDLS